MSRRLIVYNGTVVDSTDSNTASTVMERDSNKKTNVSTINVGTELQIDGTMAWEPVAKTASATVDSTVTLYEVDATSALVELTLPAVATVRPGTMFFATKTDSGGNAVKFKGSGGTENINGTNLLSTTTQYATLWVRANAALTAWYGNTL